MVWSPEGGYLYISNTNGSVYILDFCEHLKATHIFSTVDLSNNNQSTRQSIIANMKSPNNDISNQNLRNSVIFSNLRNITPNQIQTLQKESIVDGKRKIAPVMIDSFRSHDVEMSNIQPGNSSTINNTLNALNDLTNNTSSQIKDCLRCHRQKLDSLETKIMQVKLHSFGELNMTMWWENKVYDNCCVVQLSKNNDVIYSNKFENKLVRHFICNNLFYTIYDTNNILNVFTLFNNMVKI